MEAHALPDPIKRLVLALTLSVALHLALIFLVRVVPNKPAPARSVVIDVQLEQAAPAPAPSVLHAIEPKQDEPAAVAVPPEPPRPQPRASEIPPAATQAPSPSPTPSPLPTLEAPLAEDPTYYPAKQLDVQPKALAQIQPVYPGKADQEGISGEVTLLLLLDERGIVRDINVVDAKPPGYFEDSATNAFRESRWSPAQKDGRIVKSRVLIRVRYDAGLNGGKVGL